MAKIFNKELSEEDKKGVLKGFKNIKDKNEELIDASNATNKAPKNKINNQSKQLIYDVNHSFAKLRNIGDIKKLSLDHMFSIMKDYHKKFNSLSNLKTRTKDNEKRKQEVLTNVGDIYNELYDIYKRKYNKKIDRLSAKNKIKLNCKQLRLSDEYLYSSEEEQEEKQDKKQEKQDLDEFIEQTFNREKLLINNALFKKHFKLEKPILMHKVLRETKNDKEKNSKLVNIFNSGLEDLEKEIKEMSKEEIETEKPYNIVKVVKKILDFNKIEQEGQGLKILTPNQMLNRLPIALAQLQAGNNCNKFKNEIRQLLYSLYRSKNITEQIYKRLIGII